MHTEVQGKNYRGLLIRNYARQKTEKYIFKMLKEKFQIRNLYLVKISFINKGKIKIFSEKKKSWENPLPKDSIKRTVKRSSAGKGKIMKDGNLDS